METEKAEKVTLRKQRTREMGRKILSFDPAKNNTLNILYQQTTGLLQMTRRYKISDICQQTKNKGQKKQFLRMQKPHLFSFQVTFYSEICLYLCMSNSQGNTPRPNHRSAYCTVLFSSSFEHISIYIFKKIRKSLRNHNNLSTVLKPF